MKKPRLLGAVSACFVTLSFNTVHAAVLTFDELPELTGGEVSLIPNGYGGFNWDNMYYLDAVTGYPKSGYNNGLVSSDNVAFNGFGRMALTSTFGSVFNFDGAYLAAGWNNGLSVNIKGYSGATLKYDATVNPSYIGDTWYQFDFLDVDRLEFTSAGGVDADPNDDGGGQNFSMDNFTYTPVTAVPVPAAVWFFGSGLLGLVGMARRKKA